MIARVAPGELVLALRRRIDLRRLVLGDPLLKTAALAVALVLWAAVLSTAPRADVTVVFDGRVPVERPEVPSGFVLRGQLGDVGVKLRGPEDAVRAVGLRQLRASLDLVAAAPGPDPQDVPVRVAVGDERVRVVEVAPATMSVRLERRTERTIAVQARLANEPPTGFQAAPATFRPQQVTVSGPESAVAQVTAVLAAVRFGDVPLDLAQDVRPVPVDAAGLAVDAVEVDPVAVQVTVPVRSSATTRTVPVLWQLRGDVATGYWISRVATDPVVVTVGGDRAIIAALDRIDTAVVDTRGLTAARTVTVPLAVPPGVSLVGPAEATVTVTVVALTGTRPFPLVAVQVTGVGTGLAADAEPRTVDVIVTGTVPTLSALTADAVGASVDVAGRGPGTYGLDVVLRLPAGTSVQTLQPTRVTVTIRATRSPPPPAAP